MTEKTEMSDSTRACLSGEKLAALVKELRTEAHGCACNATPHNQLIAEIMDSRIPKNEREWAAAREIEALRRSASPQPQAMAGMDYIERLRAVSASSTAEAFLTLDDETKKEFFAFAIDDSERRKRAENAVRNAVENAWIENEREGFARIKLKDFERLQSLYGDFDQALATASTQAPKIITEFVNPPIPTRGDDWAAYRDGYEPGCLAGHGKTEEESIADLRAKEAEHE